jgi:hypothetical protein
MEQVVLIKQLSEQKERSYGKIAIKFRRGLISSEEANDMWNDCEMAYSTLYDIAKQCNNDLQREVLSSGLESYFAK